MPGKHAPKSPVSFYLSLSRAGAGVLGAIAIVTMLAVVAFGGGGDKKPDPGPELSTAPSPTVSASPPASATPSPSPLARPRSQVRVSVLNANARAGLAGKVSRQVLALGWNVVNVGNASQLVQTSAIFYKPGFEAEARQLQKQFPGFTRVEPSPEKYSASLTMLLGKDYPK